jgi:hypothetical protein
MRPRIHRVVQRLQEQQGEPKRVAPEDGRVETALTFAGLKAVRRTQLVQIRPGLSPAGAKIAVHRGFLAGGRATRRGRPVAAQSRAATRCPFSGENRAMVRKARRGATMAMRSDTS